LVENEDVIGTLIATNDRIMSVLEMYDQLLASSQPTDDSTAGVASALAATNISSLDSAASGIPFATKGKERNATPVDIHPDLEDLNFGALGQASNNLPPPLRPNALSDDGYDEETPDHRGTLSDFSDYESSDEETHKANAGASSKRNYVTVSDDEEATVPSGSNRQVEADPFADPFADK
jgi:hypothetical protein